MSVGLIITASLASLAVMKSKTTGAFIKSLQGYYTAEAGIEDTLLRVIDPILAHQATNNLVLAGATATITVTASASDIQVASSGNIQNLTRNLFVKILTTPVIIDFSYGAQVGAGGISMENNSKIIGDLYSDGDVIGGSNVEITGNVWISGNHRIEDFEVVKDVHANTIKDTTVHGDAYYQTITNSTVDGTSWPGSPDPAPQAFPINNAQITAWKNDAEAGGVLA